VALLLRKQGITRVRPLLGGFESWRDLGFPIEKKLTELARKAERQAI
jgi:rhodanese-related sulfurtransferase